MAKDDPESSLAEDRAHAIWSDGGLSSSTTLEGAFRDGFRAGRKHPARPRHYDAAGNQLAKVADVRELQGRVLELEQKAFTRNWEAPAESPLGIELSKIRDR